MIEALFISWTLKIVREYNPYFFLAILVKAADSAVSK